MEKRALGRGLDALIPKKAGAITSKEFSYMPLDKIIPAKNQPRQRFDKSELEELANSIKEKGIIQPILVRKIGGDKFEIVAGERRFQASKSLGLKEIPTIVKEISDQEAFVLAIVENLQRKNLNPIEEAKAFSKLIAEFNFSLADVAQFVSKDKSTIVNALRLLKLPSKIKEALEENVITRTQARSILGMEKISDQERLLEQIISQGLTVREIEKKAKAKSLKRKQDDPFVIEVEEKLQKSLGTKVKVVNKKNNKGKIIIEYYSAADFERIVKRFK